MTSRLIDFPRKGWVINPYNGMNMFVKKMTIETYSTCHDLKTRSAYDMFLINDIFGHCTVTVKNSVINDIKN